MKKNRIINKSNIVGYLIIALLNSFTYIQAQQSHDLAVLYMQGKGKYDRVFNPQTNLNRLLQNGVQNKATIEFWARHDAPKTGEIVSWKLSNLKTNGREFTIGIQEDKISLKVGAHEQETNLLLNDKLFKNAWYHFALALDKESRELRIFIDGVERLYANNLSLSVEDIYLVNDKKTDLFLAEYRAWSRKKSKDQIQLQQFRTFYKESESALSELKSNGLEIVYTNTNYKSEDYLLGREVISATWENLLYEYFPNDNLVKEAEVATTLQANKIGEIASNIPHPILNLDKVIVRASDGDGIDEQLLSGTNGVLVKWQHIDGIEEYEVKRRNVKTGEDSQQLGDRIDARSKNPSEELFIIDKGGSPNELYQYTVSAIKGNIERKTGRDIGFVLPNGVVTGIIETTSSVPTKFAKVEAIAKNNINPGGALQVNAGKKAIAIKNIDAFRQATGGGTFEFWYKTPQVATGENVVLQIGNSKLTVAGNKISVKLNETTYLEGTKVNDTNWHHYAFTFGREGSSLFEDGELIQGATTANLFALDLRNTNAFYLAETTSTTYHLDEVRFWNTAKTPVQIQEYANHIVGGNVEGLFAYYRFDFNDPNKVYNFSTTRRGSYVGESEDILEHLPANAQPSITYATYTNETGNYEFNSLNTGIQGVTNNDNKFEYTIQPSKPRFKFLPKIKLAKIPRRLNGAEEKKVNFTDDSSLPVTGVISYRIGEDLYPVLKGTSLKLNGDVVQSIEKDEVTTDSNGAYAITASPGKNTITPERRPALTNEERLNEGSLKFDGKTGYARSAQRINNEGNSFTWSGFVRPFLKVKETDVIPATQTILQWGTLSLKLINNNTLKLYTGTQERLSELLPANNQGQFVFFGVSFNKENGTLTLYVHNRKKNTALSTLEIATNVIVGAESNANAFTNFSKSHLDILEYRATAFDDATITKLREGKYLTPEESALRLSYRFDQKAGTKAIDWVANGLDNNYLQFEGAANFDNAVTVNYRREVEYTYIASEAKLNPQGESYEVVLEEPLQNVNFENITRFSFVGNIVVPCNNNVGAWTGKIVRTDIEFPKFEKTIDNNNFNNDATVFKVEGLLPGQYRVEITNVDSNRTLQSPIIDLRRSNVVYDFEFRNPIELEIELFEFDMAGANDRNNMKDYVGAPINSTCDGKYKFESHDGFKMNVRVFERYGENKCIVEDAEVTLGGDAILSSENLTVSVVSEVKEFFTQVSSPNFLGDHTRSFLISANHNGRTTSTTETAIILGARQGNSDFTLVEPQVGFVLHDPPGDNSFATLEKGATFTKTLSKENGVNTAIDNSIGAKVRLKQTYITGTATGIGAAAIVATGGYIYNANSENKFLIGGEFQYARHSGSETTVVLEKSISTPSDPTYVGEDADVFIGMSQVITFGKGQELKLEGCTPRVINLSNVAKPSTLTPFAYTKQSIQDNVIRNLYDLAIQKYDQNHGITSTPEGRDHLNLDQTLEKLLAASPSDREDKDIKNYQHQIMRWKEIIQKNHDKITKNFATNGKDFSDTTKNLNTNNNQGPAGVGLDPSSLDQRITLDALTEVSYTLTREKTNNAGNEFSGGPYVGGSFSGEFTAVGPGASLSNETKVHNFNSSTDTDTHGNNRVDSFTLNDDDAGDQFDISIKRDPEYDTPMFKTNAGRSSCPFESGTVPREGVELIVDKVVGYGTGDESILYNLTLRNTQVANDATRKTYIVGMAGSSNPLGAVVNLNESPIFEPATTSRFVFDLDPNSPTGVQQEVKAQLRIARGTDAPSEISYENIKIQMYSECEQAGDRYRSYGVDEYAEVGVAPYAEILVTAHFTGACIEEIEADAPQNDWIVNGSDKKELDFTFRIPELKDKPDTDDFSVDLEYTIKGNNTPRILKKLDLKTLKENLDADTDQVSYSADVSGLTDGEYSFRIVPVCGDGGSDNPNNRKNPTPFVKGKISRNAPQLVLTTPDNGGIHTSGTISAKFSAPINPATVNLNSLALRGILGGIPKPLTSVKLDNVSDEITIPHNNKFNLEDKFTVEMWVNPAKFPSGVQVPILQKGRNYHVSLKSDGKVVTNDNVQSNVGLQPFTWTHVAVVYEKQNGNAVIYFNGNPVGSGRISDTANAANEEALLISPMASGDSFVGALDEVRIWQATRTPAEIASNFKSQLLGNEDALEAYFVFNDNKLAKQGLSGQPDEAVQDFTGNAVGTTATGISFVTNEEAAPLDKTRTVEDIQFETTMSEGNTVINFNMKIQDLEFVEGAQLTVFIKDKKLQDPLGNKVDKASWSFIIDRSKLTWSQNNISVTQNQGEATSIEHIDLVNETGGVDVRYEFKNLPFWMKVSDNDGEIKEGDEKFIRARETKRDFKFEIQSFLSPGVYSSNIYISTSNRVTGHKLGIESFRVEVTVNCPEPTVDRSFENNHPFSMSLRGNLLINSQISTDVKDAVKVYINNQVRGYANVRNNGLVDMTVFGNVSESDALTFKVWDASECTEYEGIVENYNFQVNQSLGANSPVTFTVGEKVTQRIAVSRGFQELSFNLKDNNVANTLSLSAIKGLPVNSQIIDIMNPTQMATVESDLSFSGELTVLDVSKAYLVNVASAEVKYIQITGVPVNLNTNITITGNNFRNAIPYYPNELQRTGYALRSFTANNVSDGDRIERRGLFAEYSTTEGWRGSLTHLTPGYGYYFKASNSGAINYSGIVARPSLARFAKSANKNQVNNDSSELEEAPAYQDLGETFNANNFANFMYVNGVIEQDDFNVSDKTYTILAYVNNKLSGVSKAEYINDVYHYYLGVGANEAKEVTFKLYDGEKVVDLENTEAFTANKAMGDLNDPYVFKLKSEVTSEEVVNELSLSQNAPNPMREFTQINYSIPEDAHVNLSLYNVLGQKLHTFVNERVAGKQKHTVNWNGVANGEKLESGVYIYELTVEGQKLQRKLIIE
ncbi:Concanavalin A-like lectin/glucanases superfamily protein [Tenacibaculum sp. 190524A02b]|uniref:Concanavalin A-like lectin/glucanases superfamily protein n=1 Tax=Tenacibaculum vairaonense TaxID=3137860 RepID=A0ABP1FFY2_9FLAO